MSLLLILLGVLFVALKLTGFIFWSWWLILLPIYGPLAIGILLMIVSFLGLKAVGKF